MSKSESSKKSINSKGSLGIALSKISPFKSPKVRSEQYMTDPEIGAEILWQIKMREDLSKVSADFGCGTGLLGIGLLLLGAKKVHFVEKDKDVISQAQENLELIKSEHKIVGEAVFHPIDIADFTEQVHLVVQNPPFGSKVRHADKPFLIKATECAKVIFSFHKSESEAFVKKLSTERGFLPTEKWDFRWPLKASYSYHSKKIQHIEVSCFRLEKRS